MNHNQTETTALQTVERSTDMADPGHTSASAMMMDVNTMESLMRVAELMASGKSTVPAHLQKNPADCMAVVMQAAQWNMNPFAVAQKTHLVSGTLGYEAQLVNAVIQASGSIDGRFHYEHRGNAGSIECRVGATIKGESEITWGEWLNEAKVTAKNSPLWKTNPKQQLGYLQVKNWARLYCPGAILGVYTPDEFDAPLPRDMGAAEVIRPTASPELLDAAHAAAAHGVAGYQSFWQAAGADNRKLLADEHPALKQKAIDADKSRTVDAPAPAAQQAKAPPAAPAAKTFDEVMSMLCSAANLDALYVAGDWLGDVADPEQRAVLSSKFDELQVGFGG